MRKAVFLVCCASLFVLAFGARIGADVVVMKNGLEHKCKVISDDPDFDYIVVRITMANGSTGTISIPRRQIARIDYDYASRKARLAGNDYKGHYDLALFCIDHDLIDEAVSELRICVGQQGVPDDAYLQLAKLLEKKGDLAGALAAYSEYYKRNPKDDGVYKQIERLKKALEPKVTPSATPAPTETSTPETSAPPPVATPAPPGITVVEGLEARTGWVVALWGGRGIITQGLLGQDKILRFAYDPETYQKSACYFIFDDALNVKDTTSFSFDVQNLEDKGIQIALGLFVGESKPNSELYESPARIFPPGKWAPTEFDIANVLFKSKNSNWEYKDKLPASKIWALVLIVYPNRSTGTVEFDNIIFKSGVK